MTADVVIVGGGVIGSSIAYHLRRDGFTGHVVIIERDPSYARASSRLAMGGIRHQFGSALNIRLAQYGIEFFECFDELPGQSLARADFLQRGYLFLVAERDAHRFEGRFGRQRALGAAVERVTLNDLHRRLPDIVLDDVAFGIIGPKDGYVRPTTILHGLRRAALALGAAYRIGEVVSIRRAGSRVDAVELASGECVSTPIVINAAGPTAARVAWLAGLKIPVVPVRQQLFRAALPRIWPYRFPMVIDPDGVHWRHEDPDASDMRDRIVVAFTKFDELPGENFSCDVSLWYVEFLPALVRRLPAFAGLALIDGWAGLYEITPDHNPVLGPCPELTGFLLANGFSGHGLMMAPAAGKVLSEFVRLGRSETFDVSPLSIDRFARGEPFEDEATI